MALAVGLTLNPREVPSPLIGKPVPAFDLPPVKGRTLGLSSADLGKGEVALVNVFASWCVACREEHPVLMDLKERGLVPIHGLNYKDQPDDAARWLAEWGDPYTRTGADVDGRVGIDWGVYGVPETFVIGPDGRIAYKYIGPITPEFVSEQLMPMIADVMKGAALEFSALDRIAVTVGPGGFSAVRVGISAARGLALATGKPVVATTSLAVMAHRAEYGDFEQDRYYNIRVFKQLAAALAPAQSQPSPLHR